MTLALQAESEKMFHKKKKPVCDLFKNVFMTTHLTDDTWYTRKTQ